jgi:hypothetical protein
MTADIGAHTIFRPGNTLYVRPAGEDEWREMTYRGINESGLIFDDETETPLSVTADQVKGIPLTRSYLQSWFEIVVDTSTGAEQFKKDTACILIDPDDFHFNFICRGQPVAAVQYVHELENLLGGCADNNP